MRISRRELAKRLRNHSDLTLRQAREAVTIISEMLIEEMERHGRIEIRDFGTFQVRQYKKHKRPKFKAGKDLKEVVDW